MVEYERLDAFVQLPAAAARFASAAERLPESALDRPLPTCPGWTVRELVAHVSMIAPWYLAALDGGDRFASHPREVDDRNAGHLAIARERPLPVLVRDIREGSVELADRYDALPPDTLVPFHAGSRLLPRQVMGVALGDVLVHGYDLARAAPTAWSIATNEALTAFDAMMPLLPLWVDDGTAAEHRAAYEIRLRRGATHRVAFRDGVLVTDLGPDEPVDCHVSGDPATMLLVMYRRQSAWRAALTGKSMAWGRRPWLAFGLAHRFQAV